MTGQQQIDQIGFRRILTRNVTLPLALGVLSALIFVVLIYNLLAALNWVEHTQKVIGKLNESAKLSTDMESGMRGYLLTGDESFLTPYQVARPLVHSELDSLIALVGDNDYQANRLRKIKSQITQWDEYAQSMIEMRQKNSDYLSVVRSQRGKTQFDELRKELSMALETEQRLLKERNDKAISTTTTSVIAFLVISLLVSAILALLGRRDLMGLSSNYNAILKQQDEHGQYLQEQARMREGQAEIVQSGLGQLALPELGTSALAILSKYVNMQVGAIYEYKEDGTLSLFATYGYKDHADNLQRHLLKHEGLAGQAALTGNIIQLADLPETYLSINSALGSARANGVAIIPLKSEGHVNSVMELGFIDAIPAKDMALLEFIASNLGSAIEATIAKQKLQSAYAEVQQLNEELQVQQEELKTANEELEEQSTILEESHSMLENQKAELEQTNEQLAHQATLIDQRNDSLVLAQQALEKKAEELQKSSQYKSEFLANMSHELRTPLNSALILSKLLADNTEGNLNEEQVSFAETIYASGNDLLNLINDILDISKVEAGKLELNLLPVSVQSIADAMKMSFDAQAREKKLQFQISVSQQAPAHITTDKFRLEQILKNLLSNAFKFTQAGEVAFTVDATANGQVSFSVQDSGIGIAKDQQENIFEAFHQADGSISRKYGGTGLGLSISRDLARLLGGELTVESTPGKGSVFTLICPLHVTAAMVPQEVAAESKAPVIPRAVPQKPVEPAPLAMPAFPDDRDNIQHANRLVLIIEDETDFAKILYDISHEMQYSCLVAHSAGEGLRLAKTFKPQAILLDIRLPDASGLTVLQQLKEDPETRHIPVHALSATEQQDAALQLGAIGYAVKPKTRDELKEVFLKLEEKYTQQIKRVLVVEDDARQRQSVIQLLSDEDIEIVAVELGEEALQQLHKQVFDCMIIDLKLPDMKGNQLLQRMSTEHILSFPPVIVYTGRNLTREEEMELRKYSNSIIIKGARSPERLLDEVTLFLHKVESQLSAEHQSMLKTIRNRDRVFEGRKILLVDDDVRNIFALTKVLEHKGLNVDIARNGREAIDKLQALDDIDLVLMDIMMPEMDGYEAMREIRKDAKFSRLPIIALTAKAMKDDQELCMKAGASDYLAKPVDIDRLQSLLRIWMPNLERL
ncbi:MAG: response regulator [Methylophilus sp.]|uniref:response regulator n=1 Tax=Methylophilus sp. TaxID=29541 RepID=UPI003FA0BB6D